MKHRMIVLVFKKDSAIQKNSRISSLKIGKEVLQLQTKRRGKSNLIAVNLKETLQKVKYGAKVHQERNVMLQSTIFKR